MRGSGADLDAFERFYDATAASIRAFILRHCSDRGATDDLFQITYIKFLGSRMAATPEAPEAKAYLYRIAANAITDHGRSRQRRERFESSLREPDRSGARHFAAESLDLRDALSTLSDREQQLLWLLYAEGFDHKEAARILGVSRASVKVLAFRARKKLAAQLSSLPPSEEGSDSP